MPTLHTSRKQLSQLLTAASETFRNDDASFATVAVTGSGSAEPIGTPIVWDGTNSKWLNMLLPLQTLMQPNLNLTKWCSCCINRWYSRRCWSQL